MRKAVSLRRGDDGHFRAVAGSPSSSMPPRGLAARARGAAGGLYRRAAAMGLREIGASASGVGDWSHSFAHSPNTTAHSSALVLQGRMASEGHRVGPVRVTPDRSKAMFGYETPAGARHVVTIRPPTAGGAPAARGPAPPSAPVSAPRNPAPVAQNTRPDAPKAAAAASTPPRAPGDALGAIRGALAGMVASKIKRGRITHAGTEEHPASKWAPRPNPHKAPVGYSHVYTTDQPHVAARMATAALGGDFKVFSPGTTVQGAPGGGRMHHVSIYATPREAGPSHVITFRRPDAPIIKSHVRSHYRKENGRWLFVHAYDDTRSRKSAPAPGDGRPAADWLAISSHCDNMGPEYRDTWRIVMEMLDHHLRIPADFPRLDVQPPMQPMSPAGQLIVAGQFILPETWADAPRVALFPEAMEGDEDEDILIDPVLTGLHEVAGHAVDHCLARGMGAFLSDAAPGKEPEMAEVVAAVRATASRRALTGKVRNGGPAADCARYFLKRRECFAQAVEAWFYDREPANRWMDEPPFGHDAQAERRRVIDAVTDLFRAKGMLRE